MLYEVAVTAKEIDPQSSQFSCELTITNTGDDPLEVLAAELRPQKGMKQSAAIDIAQASLSKQHAKLCDKVADIVAKYLVAVSRREADASLAERGPLGRFATRVNALADADLVRLPVKSLADAQRAAALLEADAAVSAASANPELRALRYCIDSLEHIEGQASYSAVPRARARLSKGQQYKITFVVAVQRQHFNVASYCARFDVALGPINEEPITRTETVAINIAPRPWSLTVVAMLTSWAGVLLSRVAPKGQALPETGGVQSAAAANGSIFEQIAQIDVASLRWDCVVSAVTAAIVFNIVDFTNLRDKLKGGISWRGAVLIGFVCGYLNERVLRALQTLLGS